MKTRAKWFCLAALALICLPGCRGGDDSNVIRIVSSLPRTGSAQAQTDTIVNGIRMAIDEVGGKVGDFKIEYLDRDDATASAGQWTAEAETNNAQRAVQDPDVMAYIGPYNSGAAKVSMPILNRAGLLMISPANTATELTKPNFGEPNEPARYRPSGKVSYFRVVPADDLQGPAGADWAKAMGVKSVFVLDDSEIYGKGLAKAFAARCRQIGITVIDEQQIDVTSQQFRPLMAVIKGKEPDLVYFGGTTQSKAGQIAKDMLDAGLEAKLMVPDGCYEEAFIKAAGPEALNDRCYVTFGGLPPSQMTGRGKEFVDAYQKRFGQMPEAYAVYGYESAKAALHAMKVAGKKDRAAIVAACAAIKDFPGALGTWSFDENGDTTLRTLSGNVIRNGKFEFDRVLGEAPDSATPAAKSAETTKATDPAETTAPAEKAPAN